MQWIAAGGVCIFMIIMVLLCARYAVKLRVKICEYNQKRENTHTDRKRERAREIERDQFIGIEKVNGDKILSEVK